MADLTVETTPIPGLLVVRLPVHGDNRGWFKENWQREKMVALGLPDFEPVQNNMSYNDAVGTTRGIHAEPWDKFVSSAQGTYFGAWVDLRDGDSYGTVFTVEVDPSVAVYVPRGVGNAYQTLTPNVTYSYLVNDHWSADKIPSYSYVNLADETVAIPWPIPLDQAEISEKDKAHPRLADATRIPAKKTLILGNKGQLGRALAVEFPDADGFDIDTLDLGDQAQVAAFPWADYDLILNAAAWTNVDGAETDEGRRGSWKANAAVPAMLARIALANRQTLVHVSSDYVFDGSKHDWTETDEMAPLSVYGQSKAAGDLAVGVLPRHYILRTTWVVGDGKNFIGIMAGLAEKGVKPTVVSDQVGRLTHTSNLAAAIAHLVRSNAPYGTYNCTDGGDAMSWADIAKAVYEAHGASADDVTPVTTQEYYAGKAGIAPRPLRSRMDLTKLEATGYVVPVYAPGRL
ncbi:MAG TPA: bifunctional dTDP-4-dehydrorhamnose 3,5-epimerase family protein/NAD(P)-dependent oxidoreductase [Propionibacteriaceae bacterium]|nr:bifunctional dTDP-4-dehydrorhamnose 3,5-epimerase family protein/NAD(P)-dependent oxidoreductase [Propionibacteriaceae bacterium]HPZ48448.1 bifunctional dTDP-4-dehydrorhamnose 3,5-epimerase family protein/NAD(P)-dependent oxidoreductase [Propionibacteriaceae bacterium]HQE31651.1 bifunctional dTDP-4-dehydrorhamnose 3,5-epimerase family protein/NAD(P)-dependent oxidoreductase [Propionibacteriaceae bacterium]